MKNKIMMFIIALAACSLLIGCQNPVEEAVGNGGGLITVTIGGTNARTAVSWANTLDSSQLTHTITVSGGEGGPHTQTIPASGGTVQFSVIPGLWTILVEARLSDELIAVGSETRQINEGDNGSIIIPMHEPPDFPSITVTFHSNGGSDVESQTVKKYSKATRPEPPTLSGKGFVNWYTDDTIFTAHYDFDNPVTDDLDLYANWSNTRYTVTFYDGNRLVDTQDIGERGQASDPTTGISPKVTNPGHTGVWYKESAFETLWDFDNDTVTDNISLYVKWTANSRTVTIAAILGVTAPATGGTPVTTVTPTAQYTGIVTWMPAVSGAFAADTAYTATIILKLQKGCTMTGVAADFFTVADAALVRNAANSGVITAVFPKTAATVITIAEIVGIAVPVAGGTPTASITSTEQYTGTVLWDGDPSAFADFTLYTATITLTAKTGYTLQGLADNFFTVAGATTVSYNANSGVITAVFQTGAYALGATGPGGGKIFYISTEGFDVDDGEGNVKRCHYLEAAPANMPTNLAWASPEYTIIDYDTGINTYISITGTETAIGTGRKNTALILATDADAPAAKACNEYSNNDMTDWFLPSKDELNQLYVNKSYVNNIGVNTYWSSSQIDKRYAWRNLFVNGNRDDLNSKDDINSVRAVRAF